MPLSRSRDYLSIGEVLDSIREEFPDVSISKIRFLEAEGLINPARTESGYRMFYEDDVARLRYILSLQRDQFLPLRVIRERLEEVSGNGDLLGKVPPPPAKAEAPPPPRDLQGAQLSRKELLQAAKLTEAQLAELEDFGLLGPGESGSYDENALVVASAAQRFFEYGVQARHLKMYRQFADREASFFEQIVVPVARRRDPGGQTEAAKSLNELAGLSRQMKEAALRSSLRQLL